MQRCLVLLLLLAAIACGRREDRSPPSPPPAPRPSPLAQATQADLAHDLAEADRLGTWREVKQRWLGQVVRWTVIRPRQLCSSADDCSVAAFPIQRPARQGWLPQLSFARGQYARLLQLCGTQERCEVIIEGTLRALEVSPELPARVELSDVRVGPTGGGVQVAHG